MPKNKAQLFHRHAEEELRLLGLPEEKDWPDEWKKVSFKTYPRLEQIPLHKGLPLEVSLGDTLANRKKCRSFETSSSLTFEELSSVLFWSAGMRPDMKEDAERSRRFYPSAGALYPLEIYVCAQRVTDLEPGIYHYSVRYHALEKVLPQEHIPQFNETLGYPWSREAPLALLTTLVWDRITSKYRDFGYHLANIEAGHLAQNIQLVSIALGLTSTSLVGFNEKSMAKLLDLDPDVESPLYLSVVGKPSTLTTPVSS